MNRDGHETGIPHRLGQPKAVIRVASSEPVAKLVVRINEVTGDGKSWSVSYGVLNLTHRDGHMSPAALEPGRRYDVDVPCYVGRQ